MAAHAAMFGDPARGAEPTSTSAEDHAAFSAWFNDHRNTIDHGAIDIDHARRAVVECPDDVVGRAWKDAMAHAVALTEQDSFRAFDAIEISSDAAPVRAIEAYAHALRAASPLLAAVADALVDLVPFRRTYLGDLAALADVVTSEGLVIASNFLGEQGEDENYLPLFSAGYDEEHQRHLTVVPWSHLEALAPSTEASHRMRVGSLIADLIALAPTFEASDGGSARGDR